MADQQTNDTVQNITPWEVQGAVVDGQLKEIDYDRLCIDFGTKKIDEELLLRFEKLTGKKAHLFLRRGLFFSHREFDRILDLYEKGKPFYLYTGRGPSSDSMHLGHMVPFIFCQWLQEVFDVPIVIQLTDDEKFLFKTDLTIEKARQFSEANARDIIACGFKKDKTFIFSNFEYVGGNFYQNIVRLSKMITTNQSMNTFGFNESTSVGKLHFVAVQAAPVISTSFPHIFGNLKHSIPSLIPCAIDQDPYFRITRDVTGRLKVPRPALLHSKFFPALQGSHTKMSASITNTAIFISDKPEQIKTKINKYAFSGGGATLEEHKEKGGCPEVDVAYQYLQFFLDSDEELDKIYKDYRSGILSTGELKEICISILQKFVMDYQNRHSALSSEDVRSFMEVREMQWDVDSWAAKRTVPDIA